jgi:peptidoglycan/xylan/chitin deacetylase (PgdA/CDA1 family)
MALSVPLSALRWAVALPPEPVLPVPPASSIVPPPAGASAALSIIRHVENDGMRIAITFDACATKTHGYGFDRPVFRILQREQVPATLFVSGRWVEFHPQVMKELVAEPLIEFANHSYDHPHMNRLNADQIASELDRTEAALGRYGTHSVAFRPPFGDFSAQVLEIARGRQLPAVLWDVVSGDPSARATVESIRHAVLGQTRAGSIVIFHINGRGAKTASALPAIFRELRARGFEFVHISTLLRGSDIEKTPLLLPAPEDDESIMPLSPSLPADLGPLPGAQEHAGLDKSQDLPAYGAPVRLITPAPFEASMHGQGAAP